MSEYETGLRLVFGDGLKRVCAGTIDGVPALIVATDGPGVVGNDCGNRPVKDGDELCAFIFENRESLEVLGQEVTSLLEQSNDQE